MSEWNDQYEYNQTENQYQSNEPKRRKKGRSGAAKTAALALCCALVGGAAGAGATVAISSLNSSEAAETAKISTTETSTTTIQTASGTTATTTEVSVDLVTTGEEMTAAEVYAANVNATVGIVTSTTTNYFGYESTSAASGSGFIISSDGYILTCYHVVEDSDTITVSTYDGTSYDAELIGYDESNDLAVLKIDGEDLQTVVLGDSDELSIGDGVVAIGNPLGELTFSLTSGVVSALDREITLSSGVTMNLIQTDCAINSGNSGGALFNMYGQVVGIVNAKYSSSSSGTSIDNIDFAIPVSQVVDIVTSIIETGNIESPYIGVSITDMTTTAAANTGMTQGAVVQAVTEGSPAEEAGLQAGDVITKADDTDITCSSDLVTFVSGTSIGDAVTLTVNRSGETLEIIVTVGAQVESALPEAETADNEGATQDGTQNWGGSNGNGSNGGSGSMNPFGGSSQGTTPFGGSNSQSGGLSSDNPL
ncbi:MAG: trypsin-like peptidase domain-containing protein [Lachnospiraceae bacterium]|nr:trypsin-like peptidase domain-containing protein [Lachnospiraceae bacterium]